MCGKVKNRHRKRNTALSICLLIVYIFTSLPISYAVSPTHSVICSFNEHIHTEQCFEMRAGNGEKTLTCDFINTNESVYHIHDSFCYNDGVKICPLEENVHIHGSSCFSGDELHCGAVFHQHNEDCFTISAGNEVPVLICGETAHQHTDECYDAQYSDPAADKDEAETITLEFMYLPDSVSVFADPSESTVPAADIPDNALKLEYGTNISGIKVYYQETGNWVEITEDNSRNLPANTKYQFEFAYHDITVGALKDAGGQMIYSSLPDWFVPNSNGVLLDGEDIAADITVTDDGTIIITFYEEWLNKHNNNDTVLNGSFRVSGSADWHKLGENGYDSKLPGMNVELDFEQDLAQKYGTLDIEKSDPALVKDGNGSYYLKYELTVTNPDSVVMPDVTVKDIFRNVSYIKGYVGITDGLEDDGYGPQESSSYLNFAAGSFSADGSGMIWDIGELQPGEERTLTYYAEISEEYVSDIINNPITNTANVYSDNVLKDMDTSYFIPKNEIQISKKASEEAYIDNSGNGTIEYTVTITASDENSFVLKDLTLKDALPEDLISYLSGVSDENDPGRITITVDYGEDGETYTETVDYNNASFEFTGFSVKPGSTVTITYTISVKNIFFINNGHAVLTNTATVSKGARDLRSTVNTKTLEKQTWSRKIVGEPLEEEKQIEMMPNDGIYEYNGDVIIEAADPRRSFDVPKGSLKYRVILNENGQWDLSSTSMTDEFSNDYLKYTGYVKVQLFTRKDNASKDPSDSALISELESTDAVKTIWLKVDSLDRFKFKPEELGITDGQYTYLLTYYAQPQNMENVGSVSVSNKFRIEGKIGDGKGNWHDLPGIEVSVGTVVQGDISYDAEKTGWYYASYPVYKTDAMESGVYPEHDLKNKVDDGYAYQYRNGAIYWVIRLENDIDVGYGSAPGSGRNTSISGFVVKDKPVQDPINSGKPIYLNRDAVVGIFVGSKDIDITSYDSYPAFKDDGYAGLEKLKGNPQNDKFFPGTKVDALEADYYWYSENNSLDGIIFTENFVGKKYHKETDAVYIVLRTALSDPVPAKNGAPKTYTNELYISSEGTESKADTADYTYTPKAPLFKESKGAYIYDKVSDTFENCSNVKNVNGWYIDQQVDKTALETSGIYAAWLLNVNRDGSMSGTYDVSDYLPAGMELVYVEVNNFGVSLGNDESLFPSTNYIQELSADPEWHEMKKKGMTNRNGVQQSREVEAITYYNPTTREIRWRISNFTSKSEGEKREINFRIICKVTDPELILSQKKTYVNNAEIFDPQTHESVDVTDANVTITLKIDKSVDIDALRRLGGVDSNNNISWPLSVNKLPFKIEINPWGDDICDGDTLPALIDELSSTIELIEDSIEVIIGGNKYTDFTYDVEYKNGHQVLIIYGLPDSTPLTIKYNTRLIAKPKDKVTVSNEAYWAGYSSPDGPQTTIPDASYDPSGDVFKTDNITVEINKVDFDSHSKKLDGAVFELYEVAGDGSLITSPFRSGTTDSMGQVIFNNKNLSNDDLKLKFNTVYCIIERTAPNGYKLNEGGDEANSYYFIIVDINNSLNDTQIADLEQRYAGLDIWYESPDYSVVIENKKGTISVEKVFMDKDGNTFTPKSGSYRFGLFDNAGTKPLETLTIVYNEDGTKDYYLDGVPKESPHFTKFDPETAYQVFELDDLGNPVPDGGIVKLNDTLYRVTYSSGMVTINGSTEVTNHVVGGVYDLPSTGGMGTILFYIVGGALLAAAAVLFIVINKKEKGEKAKA